MHLHLVRRDSNALSTDVVPQAFLLFRLLRDGRSTPPSSAIQVWHSVQLELIPEICFRQQVGVKWYLLYQLSYPLGLKEGRDSNPRQDVFPPAFAGK